MIIAKNTFTYGNKHSKDMKAVVTKKENATHYLYDDGLEVILKENIYQEFNATEWVVYYRYHGKGTSEILSNIWDCDILVPLPEYEYGFKGNRMVSGAPRIVKMLGCVPGSKYRNDDEESATEFSFRIDYLNTNNQKLFYCSDKGLSSNVMMPFFDVNQGNEGAIVAIGWTGDWKAEFQKVNNGITVKTGLKNAEFYLYPGECFRATSVLVMQYYGNEAEVSNQFRRLIKSKFSSSVRRNRKTNTILANELWGGLTSEEMKKRINEYKERGIVFEEEWLDAGWYGTSKKCDDAFEGDWAMHTGNWEVNRRVHPNNLMDVKNACEEAGMRMMLWMEPERVIAGTPCEQINPAYLLRVCNEEGTVSIHQLLYLGNEAAWNYVFQTISEYIEKFNLKCLRLDFNFEPALYWETNDKPGRRGILEIKHIEGLYRLWDALLEKYPELIIDNCASGGRRIDIETMKRTIPFFRSDYQCEFNPDPDVTQAHGTNISRYLPYTGCTTKVKSDTYAARSTYASSWGGAFYNTTFQTLDEQDFMWVKKILAEYKDIREYFSCDFYNHGSQSLDKYAWAIWQYCNEESGIVLAFRREKSANSMAEIFLEGLKQGCLYEVFDYDSEERKTYSSEELLLNGLRIEIKEQYSSKLIKYRRVS